MSAIWQACQGTDTIGPLKASVTRIVESQAQVATTKLVETLDEQHILENLLESTKPPRPAGAEHYHYLIWTPFRYPPLPFGSRFGSRGHHGIFYASLALDTALAECAYYRFVFLSGMSVPLPVDRLTTAHMAFEVHIETTYGVALEVEPFDQSVAEISNPSHYEASQSLGHAMREAGVEAFTYPSARASDAGINAGILTLESIRSHQPEQSQQWICTTTGNKVSFLGMQTQNEPPVSFSREQFMVDGKLPVPAC